MAKDYSGIHTLRSLIRIIVGALGGKVDKDSIANNLTTADANVPLSAAQGKILDERLKSIDADGDGIVNNSEHFGGHTVDYFAKAGDIDSKLDEIVGEPNGLVPLDPNGQISSQYLPGYVDDVLEGYYDAENQVFYKDSVKTDAYTGETGKIYVDLESNYSYRWSGSMYVLITSSDMIEISADDVQSMWNAVSNELNPPPVTYVISFDPNGGTGTMDTQIATEGAQFIPPECTFTPPTDGTFLGWVIGAAKDVNVTAGHIYTADTTLYALWDMNGDGVYDESDQAVSGSTGGETPPQS